MRITSMDLKVVKVSIFALTQLLAAEKSLLCDYPMVVDYIMEITRIVKKDLRMVLFTFDGPI